MSQCYAPNAVPVPELGPCNTAESVSLCCTPGQICLTNGLCATGERQFYSGACTDDTYKAPICPSFCNGTDKFVVECENSVIPNGGFCCDATGTGTCCNSASNKLNLSPSVSSAVAGTAVSAQSSAGSISSSTSTSTSVSSKGPVSVQGIISSPAATPSVTTSIHTVASTITATLISVQPPAATGSSSNESNNKELAIGLGIGVSSASIFSFLLIAFALRKWKPRHGKKSNPTTPIAPRSDSKASSTSNKNDSNLHELHDIPAPVPELGGPSTTLPMSQIANDEPIIHEMDAGDATATSQRPMITTPRYQAENPFDAYPLPNNASAFSLHNPAPSPSPASIAIAQMDGLPMPDFVPPLSPPPYEEAVERKGGRGVVAGRVEDDGEEGTDIGDQKVWR